MDFDADNAYMRKYGALMALPADGIEITKIIYTQYEQAVKGTKSTAVSFTKKQGDVVYVPAVAWPEFYKQHKFPYPNLRVENAYFKGIYMELIRLRLFVF